MVRQYFPEFIVDFYLMLTEKCPLRCEYCYIKDRAHGETINISTMENLMKKMGNTKPRIIFFGGEPLLELDKIEWFVNKYKDDVKSFQVVTSAVVFFDEFIERVYKPNLDKFDLQISWDGKGNTRHTVHNNNISERVYKEIMTMFDDDRRKLPFQVRTVINDTNIDDFYNLYKLHSLYYCTWHNFYADFTIAHQTDFKTDFDSKLEKQLLNIFGSIEEDISYKHKVFIPPLILNLFNGYFNNIPMVGCNVGTEIIIRPNGDIYPCTMLSQLGDRFKMGNVNQDNIFNTDIIDELERQPKQCLDCEYHKQCLGGCKYEKICKGDSLEYINTNYCSQSKVLIDTTKSFLSKLDKEKLNLLRERTTCYMNWKMSYESAGHFDYKEFSSKGDGGIWI